MTATAAAALVSDGTQYMDAFDFNNDNDVDQSSCSYGATPLRVS